MTMPTYDAKPHLHGTDDTVPGGLDAHVDRHRLVSALREHVWRCLDCRRGFAVDREDYPRMGFPMCCPTGQQLARCLATYAGWVLQ